MGRGSVIRGTMRASEKIRISSMSQTNNNRPPFSVRDEMSVVYFYFPRFLPPVKNIFTDSTFKKEERSGGNGTMKSRTPGISRRPSIDEKRNEGQRGTASEYDGESLWDDDDDKIIVRIDARWDHDFAAALLHIARDSLTFIICSLGDGRRIKRNPLPKII